MATMILVTSGDGVEGSMDYSTVSLRLADCLISPARGYPGRIWFSSIASQGSELLSSGWSPSTPGSSKKERKAQPSEHSTLVPGRGRGKDAACHRLGSLGNRLFSAQQLY